MASLAAAYGHNKKLLAPTVERYAQHGASLGADTIACNHGANDRTAHPAKRMTDLLRTQSCVTSIMKELFCPHPAHLPDMPPRTQMLWKQKAANTKNKNKESRPCRLARHCAET